MKDFRMWVAIGAGILVVLVLGVLNLMPRPFIKWVPIVSEEKQPRVESYGEEVDDSPIEVYLMPIDDFNYSYSVELAKELKSRTGLHVKAILPTPLGGIQPFSGTSQFNGMEILDRVESTIKRIREDYGDGMVIVLTNKDINQPRRDTRFVFSFHDPNRRASVVSSARLALGNTSRLTDLATVKERVLKFALRSIAEQHFQLPRSTDESSVMFSPIMSLNDVDRMGTNIPERE